MPQESCSALSAEYAGIRGENTTNVTIVWPNGYGAPCVLALRAPEPPLSSRAKGSCDKRLCRVWGMGAWDCFDTLSRVTRG